MVVVGWWPRSGYCSRLVAKVRLGHSCDAAVQASAEQRETGSQIPIPLTSFERMMAQFRPDLTEAQAGQARLHFTLQGEVPAWAAREPFSRTQGTQTAPIEVRRPQQYRETGAQVSVEQVSQGLQIEVGTSLFRFVSPLRRPAQPKFPPPGVDWPPPPGTSGPWSVGGIPGELSLPGVRPRGLEPAPAGVPRGLEPAPAGVPRGLDPAPAGVSRPSAEARLRLEPASADVSVGIGPAPAGSGPREQTEGDAGGSDTTGENEPMEEPLMVPDHLRAHLEGAFPDSATFELQGDSSDHAFLAWLEEGAAQASSSTTVIQPALPRVAEELGRSAAAALDSRSMRSSIRDRSPDRLVSAEISRESPRDLGARGSRDRLEDSPSRQSPRHQESVVLEYCDDAVVLQHMDTLGATASSSLEEVRRQYLQDSGQHNAWRAVPDQIPPRRCRACGTVREWCLFCQRCPRCCTHLNQRGRVDVRDAYMQTGDAIVLPYEDLPARALAVGSFLAWEAGLQPSLHRLPGRARRRFEGMLGAYVQRQARGDESSEDAVTSSEDRTTASDREIN